MASDNTRKLRVVVDTEVSSTEKGLDKVKKKIKDTGDAADKASDKVKGLGDKAKVTGDKLKETGEKAEVAGAKLSKAFTSKSIENQIKYIDVLKKKIDAMQKHTQSKVTVDVDVNEKKTINKFNRVFGSVRKLGARISQEMGSDIGDGIIGKIQTTFANPPQAVFAAAGILVAALAPTIGGAIAGAVVGGAGIGGVVGGLVIASRDGRVKSEATALGTSIMHDLTSRASSFVPAAIDAINQIRQAFRDIGPDLDRIFKSSRFVSPLTDGALRGIRAVVSGIADAVDRADPVIRSISLLMERLGNTAGDAFSLLATDAREGALAIDDLAMASENLIRSTVGIVHGLAKARGGLEEFDQKLDEIRYWVEDNNAFADLGYGIDFTADGFKKGSKEAEAYRRVTTGVGTATDVAMLKQYEMGAATENATSKFKAYDGVIESAQDKLARLGTAQSNGSALMDQLARSTGLVSDKMLVAQQSAQLLRQAGDQAFGSVMRQVDAAEAYQAAVDLLSGSIKENGRSLNIHTVAGRANRDALQNLLKSNNDMFYSNIEAGVSLDSATKKHGNRIKAIKEESKRLGLNKEETKKMIEVYGKIPPKKGTKIFVDGFKNIERVLADLYAYQRSLATGKSLDLTRKQIASELHGGFAGDASAFHRAAGGYISGPGTPTSDSIPARLSNGEYVIKASAVQTYGKDFMDAVNTKKFARGGHVLANRDWGNNMSLPVNVRGSKIPTREQVASKVVPPVGAGMGYKAQFALLKRIFPGLDLISGFRAGARTLSGNQSYHALGRAIDVNPSRAVADYIYRNYKSKTKELITPWRDRMVSNGQDHKFSRAIEAQHGVFGSNAHVHWAMDKQTTVEPGPFMGVNRTGRRETLVNKDLVDNAIHIHGPIYIQGVTDIKSMRDELLKLGRRNGGYTGVG